jgi:hypothetical protein
MRRLEPLLDGLDAFSKVIEVLCNDTRLLSWIWVSFGTTLLNKDYADTRFTEGTHQTDVAGQSPGTRVCNVTHENQLAMDHISAFEKLLAAYSQIAAMLPRFDQLGTAWQDKPDFQQALAVVYSDILAFHEHAYKLFRRNGNILCSDYTCSTLLTDFRLDLLLQIVLGPIWKQVQLHLG